MLKFALALMFSLAQLSGSGGLPQILTPHLTKHVLVLLVHDLHVSRSITGRANA